MQDGILHALARHSGQPITPELAGQILQELFPERSIDVAQFEPQRCGSLVFRAERLSEIASEVDALTRQHWAETEAHRHGLEMRMDYEAMCAEERAGTLIQFTARCGDALVGNFRLYLRVSRHTQTPFAVEDTLYLLPEHRRGRNAMRLLFYARDCLRRLGYREYRASTKHTRPAAGRLLEFCGFKPVATEWVLLDPPTEEGAGSAACPAGAEGAEP